MLIDKLLHLLLFISRERVYSCLACFEVVSEINCMILYLPNWHPFGLHLPKYLQPLIEPFGYHFFHLPMVCSYFFFFFLNPLFYLLSILRFSSHPLLSLFFLLFSLPFHTAVDTFVILTSPFSQSISGL